MVIDWTSYIMGAASVGFISLVATGFVVALLRGSKGGVH